MPARVVVVALLLFAGACASPTQPSTQIKDKPGQPQSDVTPTQPPPPAGGPSIVGKYTLTITASLSCSLPAEVMTRVYTATVSDEQPGMVWVSVGGAEFVQGFDGFVGTQNGDTVDLDIAFDFGNGLVEVIDHAKPLLYDGSARVTIGDGKISGTYSGRMALYDSLAFRIIDRARYDCTAKDHAIEFVPAGRP